MQDNLTAQVGLAIVYGAASGLMALLLRIEGTRAIAWWALALLLFAVDSAVSAMILAFDLSSLWRGVTWLALGGGAIAGLIGALSFFGRRAASGVFLLAAMIAVATLSRVVAGVSEWTGQLIVFSAIAIALGWTGAIAFRAGVAGGAGRWVGSSAFFGSGIYAGAWPWMAQSAAAAHFEFYLDMVVLLWGAMGVLMMHFDRSREQMRLLAAQELALRDQLAQAERLEALGRLAAGVAHDFNNVLSIVVNGSEVVLRQLGDRPQAAAQLRVVLDAAQGAAGFTRQLLSLGRRRLPWSRPTRVARALDNALRIVKPSLSSLVSIEIESDLPEVAVRAGDGQLEQILVNLVLNGADAMPEGGALVIRVESPSEAPERVRMVVRDQGCGMDSATRAQIFEPFFTTKSAARGTGLGLTTVQAIVTQLGGSIDVVSTPGGGSVFTVELPACAPAAGSVEGPASAAAPAVAVVAPESVRILVVDDQESVASSLAEGLRGLGYVVDVASDPVAVLARAGEALPDLLVTDVSMPELRGPELASRLRRHRPGLPVVLMTGRPPTVSPEAIPEHTAWLVKPFSIESLHGTVQALLAGRREQPGAVASGPGWGGGVLSSHRRGAETVALPPARCDG